MKTVVIDGREMYSRDAAHAYLANVLSFPGYYGKNLDALYDCLTDISEPTHIVIYKFPDFTDCPENYLCSLLDTIVAGVKDNSFLTLSFDAGSGR